MRAVFFLQEGGFFIECGAHDGEFISNTLFFERYRNWTGILIEANPSKYKELKEKHRKAYTLQACVSLNSLPSKVYYYPSFRIFKICKIQKKMYNLFSICCFEYQLQIYCVAMKQMHFEVKTNITSI